MLNYYCYEYRCILVIYTVQLYMVCFKMGYVLYCLHLDPHLGLV